MDSGDGVITAARALVAKLDAIEADPQYRAIWPMLYARGMNYTGPSYGKELRALRAALAIEGGSIK